MTANPAYFHNNTRGGASFPSLLLLLLNSLILLPLCASFTVEEATILVKMSFNPSPTGILPEKKIQK
jgi:hypothetical protein